MTAENTSFQGLTTMEQVMQIVEMEFNKVEKEIELAKMRIFTEFTSLLKDANQASARKNMKLEFRNKISQEILTCQEIKGEGDTPLEVALVDDSTGNIVDVEPEASASVEILLLDGEPDASKEDDWTVEEFNKNIVPEVKDKKPLLAGDVPVKLQRGIGVVKNVTIRNHARETGLSVFKLGARVIGSFGGYRIKEAKTGSFTLKDFRKKYFVKHKTPSLSDEVSRLVNLRKGGKIDKRLQDNQINTVEKFLIQLLIDPEGLKAIVNLYPKKWEATVNNARACRIGSRKYCYIDLVQKIGVVFNVLGEVLGLYLRSHYYLMSALSENHKACAKKLLPSAYSNWGDVKAFDDESFLQQHFAGLSNPMDSLKPDCHGGVHEKTGMSEMIGELSPFDDESSLQQHFASLSTNMGLMDSLKPDCHGGVHEKTGMSEMIGELSSQRSNSSFTALSSTMNSLRETAREDFSSFSTDEVEIVEVMQLNPGSIIYDDNGMKLDLGSPFDLDTMLEDFDKSIQQNESSSMVLDGHINESNADEQSAATDITLVESEVVHTSKPPKRWKKVFCVSRWYFICKKVLKKPKFG